MSEASGPSPAEQQGETADRVIFILDPPDGQIYIGQSRAASPEPEPGQ